MSKQIADIVFFKAQAQYTTPYLPVNDKILAGHPEQQVENVYSDPVDQFHCGRWRSDIGHWKVSYTEHEYCCILKGKSRLTDAHAATTVSTNLSAMTFRRGKAKWRT